jgi:hypothetical protein
MLNISKYRYSRYRTRADADHRWIAAVFCTVATVGWTVQGLGNAFYYRQVRWAQCSHTQKVDHPQIYAHHNAAGHTIDKVGLCGSCLVRILTDGSIGQDGTGYAWGIGVFFKRMICIGACTQCKLKLHYLVFYSIRHESVVHNLRSLFAPAEIQKRIALPHRRCLSLTTI